jgi:aspartate carbamoyltransferase catalytic subunit
MASASWNRRHVLSLADFTAAEFETVMETAVSFWQVLSRRTRKVPALQGWWFTNMFFEPSTRTRSSFELAAKRLSADVLNFAPGTSSLTKGETILDTAKTYLAMGTNLMVIRHQEAGVPGAIAAEMDRLNTGVGVLNGGDGLHAHPSQALLDLFTLSLTLNPDQPTAALLKGKKLPWWATFFIPAWRGSNLWCLTACGAEVHLAAPPTLLPPGFADAFITQSPIEIPRAIVQHSTLAPALEGADFVMTLRLQKERMAQHLLPSLREYHQGFGVTRDRIQACQPTVKVLHPGPVNRGVEISSDLMDDPALSLISDQVTSGVAVRMALLYLMGVGKDKGS